jgi:hypothetical protein
MRQFFTVSAALIALSLGSTAAQAGILGLFGFDCCGGHNCGCCSHNECGCGCESGCGCACEPSCCSEPGCCEPCCGCGTGCYANGRQYAGQMYHCCCQSNVPICPCTGCDGGCCNNCCNNCCEPACGCGGGCDCGSCCEPTCGCGSCCKPCCVHQCCLKHCGFCSCCGHILSYLCCLNPCAGCGGETYWSEWHNDPPRCEDPCNCHGDWIGPGCCPRCEPCCGSCEGGCCCGCNGGCNSCGGGCPCAANGRQNPNFVRSNVPNRSAVAQNGNPNQQMANQQSTQNSQQRIAARPAYQGQSINGQPNRPIEW